MMQTVWEILQMVLVVIGAGIMVGLFFGTAIYVACLIGGIQK